MFYTILVIAKLFFLIYIFFYSQPAFVFHLLRDFYIVHDHVLAFLLLKDFLYPIKLII